MSNNLEVVKPDTLEVQRQTTYVDIMEMFAKKKMTPEDVAAFKSLVELDERMKDKQAAAKALREFNMAFSQLQREIPRVKADKAVNDKNGTLMYHYATYPEIMSQVQPILNQHGFSLRFSQEQDTEKARITYICYLIHEGGHSVETKYTIRVGRGAPGMNESKEDSAASSMAQRECLCDALNIIRVGRDADDPRLVGKPLEESQAKALMQRVTDLKFTATRELQFLKWAGATTEGQPTVKDYERIPSTRLPSVEQWLTEQENKAKKP